MVKRLQFSTAGAPITIDLVMPKWRYQRKAAWDWNIENILRYSMARAEPRPIVGQDALTAKFEDLRNFLRGDSTESCKTLVVTGETGVLVW